MPVQNFVVRSKAGLEIYSYENDKLGEAKNLINEPAKQCRFSSDGHRMAYALTSEVVVCTWNEAGCANELCRVQVSCVDFALSPMGRYLATFEKSSILRILTITCR